MALLAIDADVAARLLDKAVHHREPKAGAFAPRFGGEEGLEDFIENVRGDSAAGIRDAQQHVLTGLDVAELRRIGVVEIGIGGFDRQMAAARHRGLGIQGKVEQDALDLMRVGEGRPKPRCENRLDADILSKGAAKDLKHIGDEPVEIDPHRFERLAAGKGEQALRELRRAVGALYGRLHRLRELGGKVARGLRRLLDLPPDRVQIADDDGEQVIEVVRDAARQLSHCFHLLSLPQRLFRLVAKLRFRFELRRSRDQAFQGFAGRDRQNGGEDQRSQQREADQPAEHVAQQSGPRLALREQVAFGGEDRFDFLPDAAQELAVLARIDGGQRIITLPILGESHALLELIRLGAQKVGEPLDPRPFETVVGRERAELVQLGLSCCQRLIERFQIIGIRTQKKAA
jgi:hypothetical protein